jgi:hypothetical protein
MSWVQKALLVVVAAPRAAPGPVIRKPGLTINPRTKKISKDK